jgi:ATP-binding cassette, subfamily B, bacterial
MQQRQSPKKRTSLSRNDNLHVHMLKTYLGPQKLRVMLLGVLLISSIAFQLLNPQILKRFIDSATQGSNDRVLATAALLFLAFALIQQLCAVAATYVSENVAWVATNALRADVLLHCLRLDQSFFKMHTPGELIQRIDDDITALANFFSQLVVQLLSNVLLLVGVLIILWITDWRVGLLMVAAALLLFLMLHRIQVFATPAWKVARQSSAELFGFLGERISGSEDIRASGAQTYTLHRLYTYLRTQLRAEWRARLLGRLVWMSSDLIFTLAMAGSYLVMARLFEANALTIGTVYIIFFYSELVFRPLTQITQQAEDFQKANACLQRIKQLLDTSSKLKPGGNTSLPPGALSVSFHNVYFRYDETEKPVFNQFSLQLDAGRMLGVLGRTGSGKTSLTRLLLRFFDPEAGSIELGGVDIRMVQLSELRQRVAIVTQDVELFHASIRDNITLFDSTISDPQIVAAIESLGLTSWYRSLPHGLDTILASGQGLSAGEAQLLAFTRVLLRNPGLIIFDEASSRIDPATEVLIEQAVDKLLRGRTGIIIAHRLHTLQRVDEILVLEGGHIVEHGNRINLMRDDQSRFAGLLRTGLGEVLT